MRDPADQFDLPDHPTWQIDMAINHARFSRGVPGVIRETFVPMRGVIGGTVMTGMEPTHGQREDCKLTPLFDARNGLV